MIRVIFLAKLLRAVLAVLGLAFIWFLVKDEEVRSRVMDTLRASKNPEISSTMEKLDKAQEKIEAAGDTAKGVVDGAKKGIEEAEKARQ